MQCSNNLKQLGLAAHNYQSSFNQLPPGTDEFENTGCLIYLLPYIEQDNQYKLFSFAFNQPGVNKVWYQDPQNRPPSTGSTTVPRPPAVYGAEGRIKTFLCPSAPSPEQYATVFMSVNYLTAGIDYPSYAAGPGHVSSGQPGGTVLGRTHYLGLGGYIGSPSTDSANGCQGCEGMFTWKSKNSVARIPDGTSNTMMFAEIAGGISPNGLLGYAWGAGFLYTGFGSPISGSVIMDASKTPCGSDTNKNNPAWGCFSSMHTQLLNVCFGDGSVRGVSTNINFAPWVYLSGVADGQIINF
jgi:hypothetical protein